MCAVTRLQRKQHCCDLNWARGSEGLAWPRATCPHPLAVSGLQGAALSQVLVGMGIELVWGIAAEVGYFCLLPDWKCQCWTWALPLSNCTLMYLLSSCGKADVTWLILAFLVTMLLASLLLSNPKCCDSVTNCLFVSSQVVEVYGLLALGMSLWNQLVVPVLFMVFWLVLFALQIYSYFSTRDQPASRERLLFLFLTR